MCEVQIIKLTLKTTNKPKNYTESGGCCLSIGGSLSPVGGGGVKKSLTNSINTKTKKKDK